MHETPSEETDLIARFRAGDEAAFRTLFERHQRLLRAWLVGRIPPHVRRRFSAADVLQESCIVAFRRREDFEDRGENGFLNWLQGIVDRRLREEVRRHVGVSKRSADRDVTRSARPVTGLFVGEELSPGSEVASRELARQIRDAMARMSEADRTVLSLALEDGLPLREVAERMGRSRDATKKLYGRALSKLRRAVVPDGDHDALG
jgi:RNA polymerase sigma-70 factor (ECF subfamily)